MSDSKQTGRPHSRPSRREFLAGSAAWALSSLGCHRPSPPRRPPNIVLIVADTVRRDRLSLYGHGRETDPFIASLGESSRTYRNAYATSCWTFPSHASLFTGLYPASHGARWGNLWLDEELATLPALLQQAGYQTMGVSENSLISSSYGYKTGWDRLRTPGLHIDGNETLAVRMVREAIAAACGPFFLFINLFAAHAPYQKGGPFQNYFLTDPDFLARDIDVHAAMSNPDQFPDTQAREHLGELYDSEIRFVDSLVERIVHDLKRSGHWDSTIFVLTSDHGQGLGEHQHFGHQFYLYQNLIQIPMLLRWPDRGLEGSTTTLHTSLVDIFPNLLDAAGIDPAGHPNQGGHLLTNVQQDRAILSEFYLHQAYLEGGVRHGLPIGDRGLNRFHNPSYQARFAKALKSIVAVNDKLIQADDGSTELYDLSEDPNEITNRVLENPQRAQELERRLEHQLRTFQGMRNGTATEPKPLDEHQIEDMDALGYL